MMHLKRRLKKAARNIITRCNKFSQEKKNWKDSSDSVDFGLSFSGNLSIIFAF